MNAFWRTAEQSRGKSDGVLSGATDAGEIEAVEPPVRLLSLDALRGFIMLALASGSLGPTTVARRFPGNALWEFLARQYQHAPWIGCSLADFLQPLFLFIVGAVLPLAQANRRRQGHSECRLVWRAVRRAAIFILLGVLFEAGMSGVAAVSFVNVLAQIGLGYVFVALLAECGFRTQLLAAAVILLATWMAFALYPPPAASLIGAEGCTGAPLASRSSGGLPGFFAHWNKHDNFAAAFDRRFLNFLPRREPFVRQRGGYQTLNFIPSTATMLLGVMAGRLLLGPRTPSSKLSLLLAAGLLCGETGWLLSVTICPCVKRLWTPSWVLLSGGGAFLTLAVFYWLIDVRRCRRWCLPLAGIGRITLILYSVYGLVESLRCLVPPAARRSFGALLVDLPRGPHALSLLSDGINVYVPLALTAMLLFLLWRIGARIVSQPHVAFHDSPRTPSSASTSPSSSSASTIEGGRKVSTSRLGPVLPTR